MIMAESRPHMEISPRSFDPNEATRRDPGAKRLPGSNRFESYEIQALEPRLEWGLVSEASLSRFESCRVLSVPRNQYLKFQYGLSDALLSPKETSRQGRVRQDDINPGHITSPSGGKVQLEEHRFAEPEGAGSIPAVPTDFIDMKLLP